MPCHRLKQCLKYAEMTVDNTAVDCEHCPNNTIAYNTGY